jgi:FPC/CPF motif-containing protein YcgG
VKSIPEEMPLWKGDTHAVLRALFDDDDDDFPSNGHLYSQTSLATGSHAQGLVVEMMSIDCWRTFRRKLLLLLFLLGS